MSWNRVSDSLAAVLVSVDKILQPWITTSEVSAKKFMDEMSAEDKEGKALGQALLQTISELDNDDTRELAIGKLITMARSLHKGKQ